MKKLILITFLFSAYFTNYAQNIKGKWYGVLKVQGTQLRLILNIERDNGNYKATMDSIDQNAKGIQVTKITFGNKKLNFTITQAAIEYEGTLNDKNIIEGNFRQMGGSFPLNFSRKAIKKKNIVRPQEPTPPYPYHSKEVTFKNEKANINLSGTFTYPKGCKDYMAVILISGSGPQNRDEEIMGHKPFLVISNYLTRNQIAVLRFDDRGVGKSEGSFATATTKDFSDDVISAIKYLKTEKNIKKIGLIGHSEGGIIAPMVSNKNKDVSFVIMLAGTGMRGDKILLLQSKYIAKVSGLDKKTIEETERINSGCYKIITQANDQNKLKNDLQTYFNKAFDKSELLPKGIKKEQYVEMLIKQLTTPWMQFFLKHNPAQDLEKLKCPALVLIGEKDLQVPPKENFEAIGKAVKKSGNNKVTLKELKGLNHLFQECKTGSLSEYGQIKQTFSPIALKEIIKWIKSIK